MNAPFSHGPARGAADSSSDLRARVVDRISETQPVWASRAAAFADDIAPVLAWARETKGDCLSPDQLRAVTRFDSLVALANHHPPAAGTDSLAADSSHLPEPLAARVRAYLAELPGFDPAVASPVGSPARVVHSHALFALRNALD